MRRFAAFLNNSAGFVLSLFSLCESFGRQVLVVVVEVRAATDFSTTANISTWDQSDWSLTVTTFIPGQYQARVSLSNG